MKRGSKGQVWIETVIYTLIAFVMIGLVLAYARPKIEEMQDKAVIEQSISMMNDIDMTLLTMGGAGNQRIIELSVKKGDLKIDGKEDKIIFEIETKYTYSEPGIPIKSGNVEILTRENGKYNLVSLTRDYEESYNITYTLKDENKTISKASVPYTLKISNKGTGGSFMELDECTASTECVKSFFTGECAIPESGGAKKYCHYTSTRLIIDFELT